MLPDIAVDHLNMVLSDLPDEGVLLEWGCGGSTLYWATHAPKSAQIYSVEHDDKWWSKVIGATAEHENVHCWLYKPRTDVGPYGTHFRENPAGLHDFISGEPVLEVVKKADVIFVDGCARSSCMALAAHFKKEGTPVYLHDAGREWYRWSYPMFKETELIGPRPGHPGCLLRAV